MKIIIRPNYTALVNLVEKILRRFGYCIVPFTKEKCRVYGDSHCWILDLTKPVGHKTKAGIPYREDFPHLENLPSKNPMEGGL